MTRSWSGVGESVEALVEAQATAVWAVRAGAGLVAAELVGVVLGILRQPRCRLLRDQLILEVQGRCIRLRVYRVSRVLSKILGNSVGTAASALPACVGRVLHDALIICPRELDIRDGQASLLNPVSVLFPICSINMNRQGWLGGSW